MNAKRKTAKAKRKTANAKRKTAWNGGSFTPKPPFATVNGGSFYPKATVRDSLAAAPNRRQDRTRLAQRLSPIHNSPQGRKMPFSDLNLVERRKITTFADNIIIQRT